jgi:hypothetical protein
MDAPAERPANTSRMPQQYVPRAVTRNQATQKTKRWVLESWHLQ